MEGVVDHLMRELLSGIGGIDLCVTEFIRITNHLYPERVFYRRCPELYRNSQTASGTPVRVQLLGGDPQAIADNAEKVAGLGASAIDLNFGCPAKTVNKSDGGACLLREPHRVNAIVAACRKQVPEHIPVTAKIRLGFDDRSRYLDNALAAYEGGADELTVHARSKADGYRPPAYWEYVAEIKQAIPIRVTANGEIWNREDAKRCLAVTQCDSLMLGRGLLSHPDLARQIKADIAGENIAPMKWSELTPLLARFFERTANEYPAKYMGNRLKQWLFYLTRQYPEAKQLFALIKRSRDQHTISNAILASAESSHDLPLSA